MWRKSDEVRPSSPTSVASAPDPIHKEAEIKAPWPAPSLSAPSFAAPATGAVKEDRPGASRIGSGLKIRGELSGNSDLSIDGVVEGSIHLAAARVTIGPSGRVQADVEAREIVVNGSVQGNLKVGDCVRLGGSSRVQGSILTPRISIDDGARLRGKVETIRPDGLRLQSEGKSAKPDVLQPVSVHAEED